MKKFHIALAVTDIEASVSDYAQRLECRPDVVIPHEYALWRTPALNLSIRRAPAGEGGTLRHLGWEDPASPAFSAERDVNGILWEHFSSEQQAEEIRQAWPSVTYRPR
jgi:hypothetical protein